MPVCDNCFDPDCARSLLATDACNCIDIPTVVRDNAITGVTYSGVVANLPQGASGVTVSLIDSLRRYQPPGVTVPGLSAAATTLYNNGAALGGGGAWYSGVDGADAVELFSLVEVFKHHPEQRDAINHHFERLTLTAANAAQRTQCEAAHKFCTNHRDVVRHNKKDLPKTASEFEDRRTPRSRLYLLCTKGNMTTRLTAAQSGATSGQFDATLGTNIIRFEKIKDVKDINTLHGIIRDFQSAISLVGRNGGKVAWAPFWEAIFEILTASMDPVLVHELIYEALVKMDELVMDALTFMNKKWSTFYTTFMLKFSAGENDKAGPIYPRGSPTDNQDGDLTTPPGTGREHVKFGPVTQQGAWSGEMRTRNGAIAFCNKWNQGQPCNRGVFTGRNKGKCAYTHKCRYCMSTNHTMDEKYPAGHANAGEWKCPKHP
jgi:hypothetical protein